MEVPQEGDIEPEIMLHALTGWTAPKNMWIKAKICAHDVVILIDSVSTHNFISERLANLMRLPMIPTETFTVQVDKGDILKCQGRFEAVRINLHDTIFSCIPYHSQG